MSYAELDDFFVHGLPVRAVDEPEVIPPILEAASRTIDEYVGLQYAVPLTNHPRSIREAACKIAAWEYVSGQRGRQPGGPDEVIRLRYEDVMRWLRDVAAGRAVLADQLPPEASANEGAGTASKPLRGW